MAFQPSVDSFGIRRLGLSVVGDIGGKQTALTVASKRNIFSENHDYKSFFHVAVILYLGSRYAWWQKIMDNYSNPCRAHARRGLIIKKIALIHDYMYCPTLFSGNDQS